MQQEQYMQKKKQFSVFLVLCCFKQLLDQVLRYPE